MAPITIRDATPADNAAIAAVYNHYITNTVISFEVEPVTSEEMGRRVEGVASNGLPWLVLETEQGVVGYAYAGRWHARAAYRHTVETSIYLAPDACGLGHGARLYRELFSRLQRLDVHVMIGGVALPNAPSVALHEGLGFKKAAHFREVGYKFGQWIDVGYWQRILEPNQENA